MRKKTRRYLSLFLAALMIMSAMPASVFAAPSEEPVFTSDAYSGSSKNYHTDAGIYVCRDSTYANTSIMYGSNGTSIFFGRFTSESVERTYYGFCAEPDKSSRPEGINYEKLYQITDSSSVAKFSLLWWLSPAGGGWDDYGKDFWAGVDVGLPSTYSDEDKAVVYTHLLIAYYFGTSKWNYGFESCSISDFSAQMEAIEKMAAQIVSDGTFTIKKTDASTMTYTVTAMESYYAEPPYTVSDMKDLQRLVFAYMEAAPATFPISVLLYKIDAETGECVAQGDGSLAGAQYTVKYYDNTGGDTSGDAVRTWVFETDEYGRVCLSAASLISSLSDELYYDISGDACIPIGTVTIEETKAPAGYLIDDAVYTVIFKSDDDGNMTLTASYVTSGNYIDLEIVSGEQVIRGGIMIQKRDTETGYDTPLGGAALEGAVFEIYNRSPAAVVVGGVAYEPGEVLAAITTDENGFAILDLNGDGEADTDALPYGDYEIAEVEAPDGYLLEGAISRTFSIEEDGKVVDMTELSGSIADYAKRGDFCFTKKNDDYEAMANVVFKITSDTTRETHYFATDANGLFDSSLTDHSNAIDAAINSDGSVDEEKLAALLGALDKNDDMYGIWFGADTQVDTSLGGSLPYDIYTVTELRSSANEGYILRSFTLTVSENDYVIDCGAIIDSSVGISTYASNAATGTHFAAAREGVDIIDQIELYGVENNREYTVTGVLINGETGEVYADQNGNTYTVTETFAAGSATAIAFENVDCTGMGGSSIVIYAYVTNSDGIGIASEEVLTNIDETIWFPSVATMALDKTSGTHYVTLDSEAVIDDTVSYTNLQPGKEYILSGYIVDAQTGEAVTESVEAAFTAEEASGETVVSFTIDATTYAGRKLVVFEKLYTADGVLIAEHTDLEDEDQTVYTPDTSPKTGDDTSSGGIWMIAAGAGALCACVIKAAAKVSKKRKKN